MSGQMSGTSFAKSLSDAEARAKCWGVIDPFPDIPPALLNSADISDYIRVTGMIYPFHEEDLEGATYIVRLRGMCIYYEENEPGKQPMKHIFSVGKDGPDMPHAIENYSKYNIENKLVLKPNSITFLTLEPVFQVPSYMAFRFNLKISHVYKGLLLGTGPIIDPGFKGRLSIPLHNLTGNEYVFLEGEEIISLEVTKMSPIQSYPIRVKNRLGSYIPMKIPPYRQVDEYIARALKKTNANGIVSSVTSTTNEAIAKVDNSVAEMQKFKNIGVFTILGVAIAIFTLIVNLLMPSYQLVQSVADTQASYEHRIEELESQLTELEKQMEILKGGAGDLG